MGACCEPELPKHDLADHPHELPGCRPAAKHGRGSLEARSPHIAALQCSLELASSINLDSRAASVSSSHLDDDKAVVSHLLKYARPIATACSCFLQLACMCISHRIARPYHEHLPCWLDCLDCLSFVILAQQTVQRLQSMDDNPVVLISQAMHHREIALQQRGRSEPLPRYLCLGVAKAASVSSAQELLHHLVSVSVQTAGCALNQVRAANECTAVADRSSQKAKPSSMDGLPTKGASGSASPPSPSGAAVRLERGSQCGHRGQLGNACPDKLNCS